MISMSLQHAALKPIICLYLKFGMISMSLQHAALKQFCKVLSIYNQLIDFHVAATRGIETLNSHDNKFLKLISMSLQHAALKLNVAIVCKCLVI